MKKPSLFLVLFPTLLFSSGAFAQNREHAGGGRYLKRVESNLRTNIEGAYNFDGKSKMEMLFFGDRNAEVEFFEEPSAGSPVGFRLVRDTTEGSYTIETKRVPNFKEVEERIGAMYPTIGISGPLYEAMTDELSALIREHNARMWDKQNAAKWELFEVETKSVPVSDRFAERLRERMLAEIDGFRAKGRPEGILDGRTVTFRAIEGDEVRMLRVLEPRGNSAAFADFCDSIAEAIETGEFDATSILKALKK